MTDNNEKRMAQTIALREAPEVPLVAAAEAKKQWQEYQALKESTLDDEDYLWFLEWDEVDPRGRAKVRRKGYSSRKDCEAAAKRRKGSRIRARMIKSACRKMARFFGLEIPALGQGQVERVQEGNFIISTEHGDFYTHTEWLDPKTLQMVKASTTVFIVSKTGRSWMGRGGAHQSEGFAEDFAVGATSFTRAVNRATLDLVGWGEETGEELRTTEELLGEEEPPAKPSPARSAAPQKVETEPLAEPPVSADDLPDMEYPEPEAPASADTTTRTMTTAPETQQIQQAWNLVRQGMAKMGANVRGRTISWLKLTTGKEIPANIFDGSTPPLRLVSTSLIYQLAQRVKDRQLELGRGEGA